MLFKTRNPYYLRLSEKAVLPIFLYLDDRHLEWMSDRILQHVLEDLRPKIIPKLEAESHLLNDANSASKRTIETHRGENYQFCYFLRKMQPLSVVMKSRHYVATGRRKYAMAPPPPPPPATQKAKEKGHALQKPPHKRARTVIDVESEMQENTPTDDAHDSESQAQQRDSNSIDFLVEPQNEEEKPKPLLRLKYQVPIGGMSGLSTCLCIVVEPWPPLRSMSRAPSEQVTTARASSIAPPEFIAAHEAGVREKTPLFLPDFGDYDGEMSTTLSSAQGGVYSHPFDDNSDEEDDGMMQFSQILNSTGDQRAGAIADDDDLDGAVFFGDADEVKEL